NNQSPAIVGEPVRGPHLRSLKSLSWICHRSADGGSMFAWFQRLLPRKRDFFGMFEAHAATLVAGAAAMSKLVEGAPHAEQIALIETREHDADDITREVLTEVR